MVQKAFKILTNNCIDLETVHSALFIHPLSRHFHAVVLESSNMLTANKHPDIWLMQTFFYSVFLFRFGA